MKWMLIYNQHNYYHYLWNGESAVNVDPGGKASLDLTDIDLDQMHQASEAVRKKFVQLGKQKIRYIIAARGQFVQDTD